MLSIKAHFPCPFPVFLHASVASPESVEIAKEDDVAACIATRQQQLLAVRAPVEIADQTGGELRQLFWLSSRKRLLPEVGDSIPGNQILQALPIVRPVETKPSSGSRKQPYRRRSLDRDHCEPRDRFRTVFLIGVGQKFAIGGDADEADVAFTQRRANLSCGTT